MMRFKKNLTKVTNANKEKVNRKEFGNLLKKVKKRRTKLSAESKKLYSEYQHIYKTYLEFHEFNENYQDSLANFFFLMLYHYARSTLWAMYSAVCVWYLAEHHVEVKTWPNVLDMLKAITKNHVAKKAMVFIKEKMKKIFNYLENKIKQRGFEGFKALSTYIGIAMAYYGLCRIDDLKKITTDNFHHNVNEEGEAYYTVIYKPPMYNNTDKDADTVGPQQASKSRKCGVELFDFDLPTFVTLFVDLMIENTPEAKQNSQMVRNANKRAIKKGSNRIFNQGSSKGIMYA